MAASSSNTPRWIHWLLVGIAAWLAAGFILLLSSFGGALELLPFGLVIVGPAVAARVAVKLIPERKHAIWLIPAMVAGFTVLVWLSLGGVILTLSWYFHRPWAFSGLYWVSIVVGIVMGFSCGAVWFIFPRMKAAPRFFKCSSCGYELVGSLHAARCPECGHFLLVGQDIPYLAEDLQALEELRNEGVPEKEE